MKYNYSKYGYHPRDVSFEVTAICLENDERAMRGAAAVKDTVIGTSNYSRNDYAKQMELAFNPVTNNEATVKYVKHHHLLTRLNLLGHEKKKEKNKAIQKRTLLGFLKSTAKKSFNAVIQNMLTRHIIAEEILSGLKTKGVTQQHHSFLAVHDVNQIIEQKNIKVKYSIHPHVDSLLRTRYGDNALHL